MPTSQKQDEHYLKFFFPPLTKNPLERQAQYLQLHFALWCIYHPKAVTYVLYTGNQIQTQLFLSQIV